MPRAEQAQLNVRSTFARRRAHELAKATGMTATEVVEDALRGYVPPGGAVEVGRLERRGPVLVLPRKGRIVSLEEAEAALIATREQEP
jgi:hypothetical protein